MHIFELVCPGAAALPPATPTDSPTICIQAGSPFDRIVRMLTLAGKKALHQTCPAMHAALDGPMQYQHLKHLARSATLPDEVQAVLERLFDGGRGLLNPALTRRQIARVIGEVPDWTRRVALRSRAWGPGVETAAIRIGTALPLAMSMRLIATWKTGHAPDVLQWAVGMLDRIAALPAAAERDDALLQWLETMNIRVRNLTPQQYIAIADLTSESRAGVILAKMVPLIDWLGFESCMQMRALILKRCLGRLKERDGRPSALQLPVIESLVTHLMTAMLGDQSDDQRQARLSMLMADWRALIDATQGHARHDIGSILERHTHILSAEWLGLLAGNARWNNDARHDGWQALAGLAAALEGEVRAELLCQLAEPDFRLNWEENETRRLTISRLAEELAPTLRDGMDVVLATCRLFELRFGGHAFRGALAETRAQVSEQLESALALASREGPQLARLLSRLPAPVMRGADPRPLNTLLRVLHRAWDANEPGGGSAAVPTLDVEPWIRLLPDLRFALGKVSERARIQFWKAVAAASPQVRSRRLSDLVKVALHAGNPVFEEWLALAQALPDGEHAMPFKRLFLEFCRCYPLADELFVAADRHSPGTVVGAARPLVSRRRFGAGDVLARIPDKELPGLFSRKRPPIRIPLLIAIDALASLARVPSYQRLALFLSILDKTEPSLAIIGYGENDFMMFGTLCATLKLLPAKHRDAGRRRIAELLETSITWATENAKRRCIAILESQFSTPETAIPQ